MSTNNNLQEQRTGLNRNFLRSPISTDKARPGRVFAFEGQHQIRYIDRVEWMENQGTIVIHWLGQFDRTNAIYFQSRYEIKKCVEADLEILREMWCCAYKEVTTSIDDYENF